MKQFFKLSLMGLGLIYGTVACTDSNKEEVQTYPESRSIYGDSDLNTRDIDNMESHQMGHVEDPDAQFTNEMEQRLETIENKLARLREKALDSANMAKTDLKEKYYDLVNEKEQLVEKFNRLQKDLKQGGEENWEGMKSGVKQMAVRLEDRIETAQN